VNLFFIHHKDKDAEEKNTPNILDCLPARGGEQALLLPVPGKPGKIRSPRMTNGKKRTIKYMTPIYAAPSGYGWVKVMTGEGPRFLFFAVVGTGNPENRNDSNKTSTADPVTEREG
jgi:hypothetical protein